LAILDCDTEADIYLICGRFGCRCLRCTRCTASGRHIHAQCMDIPQLAVDYAEQNHGQRPNKVFQYMKYGGISVLIGLLFSLPAQCEQVKKPHLLQAIFFESYLTQPLNDQRFYDTVDLPSNDFPLKFSRLIAPFNTSETIQFPLGFEFPRTPMFLDFHTFTVTDEQIKKQKSFSHYNDLQHIHYQMRVLSWSNERYRVDLEGRYEDLKFKNISFEAALDKTKIIRIRRSVSRTVYIAFTVIEAWDLALNDVIPPKPIYRALPIYPSDLLKTNWSGTVRILTLITEEGKADAKKVILLNCPHYLFGRNSLDVVLNQWTFKPATRDGVPVDCEAIVEVDFFK
jgi:hypothetical protein